MKVNKLLNITTIAVLTTITILVWVGTDAYLRLTKKDLSSIPQKTLAPLNPSLDQELIGVIENKKYFTQEELSLLIQTLPPDQTQEEEISLPERE